MKTDETTYDSRIAIQPETGLEQEIVAELFVRLKNIANAPRHPEKVGSEIVFYTLDLDEFGLNHDLWERADAVLDENGKIDPEPGSRALVVVHGDETGEESSEATEEEVEEAVEAVSDAERGSDFDANPVEVARGIHAEKPLSEAGEERLWELASDVEQTGLVEIDTVAYDRDQIEDALREYVTVVGDEVREVLEAEEEGGDDDICGWIKDNDEPCQRDPGWGRDADEGYCQDHHEMAQEEAEE